MSEKTKPVKRPTGLVSIHRRLLGLQEPPITEDALRDFAALVVSACDEGAPETRRLTFAAVEDLRDS